MISADIAHPLEPEGTDPASSSSPLVTEGLRGVPGVHRLLSIHVDRIRHNPMQPRRAFEEASLQALAASIRDRGTLQPIVVRPSAGGFELIAGERRLRAVKIAGLSEVPAIVRDVRDEEMLELALIENIHRADLNPIERARAYRSLQQQYDLSHEEIATRMGEDRATVTNYIRLLGLAEPVIELVASGELTSGHAKALMGIEDHQAQISFAERAHHEAWSVRQLEAAVAKAKQGAAPLAPVRQARAAVADMEQRLSAALGLRVTIKEGRRRHTGRIVIEYYSLDDFERIAGRLGITGEAC